MLKSIVVLFFVMFAFSGCTALTTTTGKYDNKHNTSQISESKQDFSNKIFFALNSSSISEKELAKLKNQAKWLNDNSSLNIVVEGHCDERGTREVNIALGERRAEAIKNCLIRYGVKKNRISVISYGKERPAVMGDSEFAWQQNRRGIILVQ